MMFHIKISQGHVSQLSTKCIFKCYQLYSSSIINLWNMDVALCIFYYHPLSSNETSLIMIHMEEMMLLHEPL